MNHIRSVVSWSDCFECFLEIAVIGNEYQTLSADRAEELLDCRVKALFDLHLLREERRGIGLCLHFHAPVIEDYLDRMLLEIEMDDPLGQLVVDAADCGLERHYKGEVIFHEVAAVLGILYGGDLPFLEQLIIKIEVDIVSEALGFRTAAVAFDLNARA